MKILILISLIASAVAALARPNVLFIAVDDLRAELGCYGAEHIVSPNIDKLAASGVRFERAYCQQAICGPSRASVMTGLRPDSVQVHGNHTHFREIDPEVVTLPQHFKNHGYRTQSMGKLYHGVFPPGSSRTVADTFGDAPSWSVPTFRPGPRYYYTEEGIAAAKRMYERLYGGGGDWTEKLVFGPATEAPDVEDGVLYDGQVADRAVETLRELGSRRGQPFFLAVGFIKPHSPYIAPKKYWDLYDGEALELAEQGGFPDGAPALAGHGSGELRRYTDQAKRGVIPEDDQRTVRHAYYACVSYIDAQVGKVLGELERQGLDDDTIVVLWSDHGYHLGEKGLWGKTTNFELDARVPLIVRAPGRAGNGERSEALVELVDLYPTLAELAGLPVGEQLEGTSFVSLLDNPDERWKRAAFTQFTRGKRRGYSIASGDYRYVEWYEVGTAKLLARELYDHREDVGERRNLAVERPGVARRLARLLDRGEGWRDVPTVAELEVAGIFGDGMVVQRGTPGPVWGEGAAGAEVRVSFGGQSVLAVVDGDGQWRAELVAMEASRVGRTMRVACGEGEVAFDDVLVGEVWVCAGQSNMRWMVKQSAEGERALAGAENAELRLIDFKGRVYPSAKRYPVAELRAGSIAGYYGSDGWRRASAETVSSFSAVAYYFGAALQRELGVPVGLVHNAVGGVPMESYVPREVMEADAELSPLLGDWTTDPNMPTWVRKRGGQNLVAWSEEPTGMRPRHPFEPGFLFEAGMRPLVPMAHAGFIWYQGESNATE
ncbi:MAG: sulfatase, partial [Verrucomicrobiales bacterium]|nr:sulfatase [Verrucomicrobiales bacterium]